MPSRAVISIQNPPKTLYKEYDHKGLIRTYEGTQEANSSRPIGCFPFTKKKSTACAPIHVRDPPDDVQSNEPFSASGWSSCGLRRNGSRMRDIHTNPAGHLYVSTLRRGAGQGWSTSFWYTTYLDRRAWNLTDVSDLSTLHQAPKMLGPVVCIKLSPPVIGVNPSSYPLIILSTWLFILYRGGLPICFQSFHYSTPCRMG